MITLHKTIIRGFDFPYFTIVMANKENLEDLEISKQIGIRSKEFITKCTQEFEEFKKRRIVYNRANVQDYFAVKFN